MGDEARSFHAVILAAGVGRRLGGGQAEHPKCLLVLEGRTLLDRMLDALEETGVREVTIVVGHLAEQIREAVRDRKGVRTVLNPDFRKGAILSLYTARECLWGNVLVMDADVLFPVELLRRLVQSPHENSLLLDPEAEDNGEAMMVMTRDGRAFDVARGRRGSYDLAGETVGFQRLGAGGAAVLRRLLEEAVGEGRDDVEHEALYPAMMREVFVGFETTTGLPWLEIDFPEDVERARLLARCL